MCAVKRKRVQRKNSPPQYAYLPYLTWALLALLLVWAAVWYFFYRPSTQEQLMVASFASALNYIPKAYVKPVDREVLYQAAMKAMVAALGDRYSAYLTRADMRMLDATTEGEFGGIGVTVTRRDGLPLIVEVLPDSPADRAGLAVGDLITSVDGKDVNGLELDQLVELIRGKVGSSVELGLRRPSTGLSFTRKLVREKIHLPNVEWDMLDGGLGRLRIAFFSRDVADQVERALKELGSQGLRGLLLDLRGNAGGLVEQAVEVCDMFLRGGLIIAQKSRHRELERMEEAKPTVLLGAEVPVVVLVDEATASAAEIVAGALQANGRATLVGTRTVGKGSVTKVVELPDGSGLTVTVSHYLLAGGEMIDGKGLKPDVVVGELPPVPEERTAENIEHWRQLYEKCKADQLARGIQILKDKVGAH